MIRLYLAFILYGLFSCGKKSPTIPTYSTEIDVVYNMTEHTASPPSAEAIIPLFGFDIDKDQAADFEMVLLKGTVLNASEKIHLDGLSCRASGEEKEAHAQSVTSFCDAVRTSIMEYPRQYRNGKLPHRIECFATIAQELQQLAKSNASQRLLLVFTSLMENEPAFSSYSTQGLMLLSTNPQKVAELLQQRRRLPNNLVGISVIFIQPSNSVTREVNAHMLAIYERLLRERGARIIISSSAKQIML